VALSPPVLLLILMIKQAAGKNDKSKQASNGLRFEIWHDAQPDAIQQ